MATTRPFAGGSTSRGTGELRSSDWVRPGVVVGGHVGTSWTAVPWVPRRPRDGSQRGRRQGQFATYCPFTSYGEPVVAVNQRAGGRGRTERAESFSQRLKLVRNGERRLFPRNPWSSWLAENPAGESWRGFRVSATALFSLPARAAALSVSRVIGSAGKGCR